MRTKVFHELAEEVRTGNLTEDSRIILNGRLTSTGQLIRVYRGLAPGETRASSIGHFLIVTAANLARTQVDAEIIPAGSRAVRHPSLSRYGSEMSVATSLGTLFLGTETHDGLVDYASLEDDRVVPTLINPPPLVPVAERIGDMTAGHSV
jgi:hypothetical protein